MWCEVRAKWVVLWSLWAARLVRVPTPAVRLADGRMVRGQLAPDGSHNQFFGIPYATVHHGNRFQAPESEPIWEGVYDAIDEHVRCPQKFTPYLVLGDEDCLRINVYAPMQASVEAPLPVMVFIHGGGFKEGSSARLLYGPDYLVAKGVVLVTFNYRLTVLGFLCLGIKEAPGNAAMKDQVAALKWVQKHIRAFGGNPDNVTIFGESAGAASVSYHVVSPMSRGLFHKAITQSGSSLAPWAEQHDAIYFARLLVKAMGHDTENVSVRELYNILKDKTTKEIVSTQFPHIKGQIILGQVLYAPCTEKAIEGVEAFLKETPYELLARGEFNKVPMIIGSNDEEGYYFGAMETKESLHGVTFETVLPRDLVFPSDRQRNDFAQELKKLYNMDDDEVSLEHIVRLSKLHGEPYFIYPAIAETLLILNGTDRPVFNYVLKYDGWRNFPKWVSGWRVWGERGASHADDLFYLFRLFPVPTLFEHAMIDRMTTMWTNFAKYGFVADLPDLDPTPTLSELLPLRWVSAAKASPWALMIDAQLAKAPLLYTESLKAWQEAYSKYRMKDRQWHASVP